MEKPTTSSQHENSEDSFTDSQEYSDSEEEEVLFDGRGQDFTESEESSQNISRKSSRAQEPEEESPTLVPEKCQYCGINHANELVKCLDCGEWYCNTKLGRGASHAIFHLVRRKHKKISKHPKSQFGELHFECFFCKNQNIFQMGLVPYVMNGQRTFLISCRKFFCTTKQTVSQFQLKEAEWRPLILEKQLLDFLVTCSQKSVRHNESLKLRVKDLTKFENQRMKGKETSLAEQAEQWREEEQVQIQRIPLTWPDVESYCRDFLFLVQKEMEEDQKQKEAVFFTGLSLDWSKASRKKKKILIVCKLPIFEEVDINSFTNQMIELSLPMKSKFFCIVLFNSFKNIFFLILRVQRAESLLSKPRPRENPGRVSKHKPHGHLQEKSKKRNHQNRSKKTRNRRKKGLLESGRNRNPAVFIRRDPHRNIGARRPAGNLGRLRAAPQMEINNPRPVHGGPGSAGRPRQSAAVPLSDRKPPRPHLLLEADGEPRDSRGFAGGHSEPAQAQLQSGGGDQEGLEEGTVPAARAPRNGEDHHVRGPGVLFDS